MESSKFDVPKKKDKEIESMSDDDNLNGDGKKARRKRRSKNEQEGRNFKCPICEKAYLSQPALTNHNKTKHFQDDPNFIKRGRGRPRKNPIFNNPERDVQKFKLYFLKENRRKSDGELTNIIELSQQAFFELFDDFRGKIFQKIDKYDDHLLLKSIIGRTLNKNSETIIQEPKTADEIFACYLIEYHLQTNKNYFNFMLKFVVLFRECINKFKTPSDSCTKEFSQLNGADSVPDFCNEFITEFMENNNNFNLDTTEIIEIIQHFCNWLYENKHTTSRLTLLS